MPPGGVLGGGGCRVRWHKSFLPVQARFGQGFPQLFEGFLLSRPAIGRLCIHILVILLLVQQGDVLLGVLGFIFLFVFIGFVSVYVIYGGVVVNLSPCLLHVLVFASDTVSAVYLCVGQLRIQELCRLHVLVWRFGHLGVKQVEDKIGCNQQGDVQDGGQPVFGLPEIDSVGYLHCPSLFKGSFIG